MGIPSLWVNGYAGGPHAWNYVSVNDKWYLMDTTWGGQNWYLRGEVENHGVYDTYHIMPTLEKEGIPYKWGQYPGVWISTEKSTILTLGETFNALDYIKDVGDIYGSDLSNQVKVTYNDVNTQKAGEYTVVYQVENKDGNKVTSELIVKVVDGKKVLASELTKLSGNLRVQPVSLYLNGKEVPYDNGLFIGEAGSTTYSIEGQNIKYFEANVGINKNVRDNTAYGSYGKVQFEVYADDELIYQSAILGWKDNYEHILVEIPENAKTIKLVNVPKGSGNNHGAWGNPVFFSQDDKVVAEKENLAQLIAFADQIQDTSYVLAQTHQEVRLQNLQYAREYAKSVINSNSKDAEEYKQAAVMLLYSIEEVGQTYVAGGTPVQVVKEDPALKVEKENLEQLIAFADQIKDVSYVLEDTHQESRLGNLEYARDYAKGIINSESTKVEEYKQAASMLLYSIEELGQTYVAGGTPVQAVKEKTELDVEKENLAQIIAFADQINDVSYVLAATHKESRLESLVYVREYAKGIMNSNSTNVDDYKQAATMVLYYIDEVGQNYVAGGAPVK